MVRIKFGDCLIHDSISLESLVTFLLAASGKVKMDYGEVEKMLLEVLPKYPQEIEALKKYDNEKPNIYKIFANNGLYSYCHFLENNFEIN